MTKTQAREASIITWDWKAQPDGKSLAFHVGTGKTFIYSTDTGTDDYAMVLSTVPLNQDEVDGAFALWLTSDCPESFAV